MRGKQEPANASTKLESMAVKKTTPYLLNALSFKSLKLKTKQQELLIRVFILGLVYVLAFIARLFSVLRGSSEIAAEVRQDEPPQKKKKKDKKKKPAEKDPVPSVGAENRKLVVHEESSRGNAALTDDGLSSFRVVPLERGRREPSVDREAPAREVGPGDADPVLPAEGRETRPGLDDLVELSDSSIERRGQNESSDGAPPGVGEDLNASSIERGDRGSEDAIAQVPEEPESRNFPNEIWLSRETRLLGLGTAKGLSTSRRILFLTLGFNVFNLAIWSASRSNTQG
ncbi:hypothetical protein F2Q69_00030118 [Brassica cretica]|uniref:Uncharacterized protein n=1 Tax=Brassica cretica TaxID=69181 RepID=A0A8S9S7S0_BRACR|nr:hypothetical protein F2Q69_00030118 [Brassica cretica]